MLLMEPRVPFHSNNRAASPAHPTYIVLSLSLGLNKFDGHSEGACDYLGLEEELASLWLRLLPRVPFIRRLVIPGI